jgi:hypothetical protein
MSTARESKTKRNAEKPPPPTPDADGVLNAGPEPDAKDKALQALEDEVAQEKEARREERFIWIVVCVILIDVLWFRNAANATLPVVIFILELVALFVLARRMDIKEIVNLVDRVLYGFSQRAGPG